MPLNDSLFFTNECNLTASQPKSILTDTNSYCTTSVAWTGADELSASFFNDCRVALNIFFRSEVCPHGVSEFEFAGERSVPFHHYLLQLTPRRYYFRTCTIAIINKPDIPQAFWLGPSLGIDPETDVASYDEIYLALLALRNQCQVDREEVGWTVVGEASGVVLMVFKTSSPVDVAIRPRTTPVQLAKGTVEDS